MHVCSHELYLVNYFHWRCQCGDLSPQYYEILGVSLYCSRLNLCLIVPCTLYLLNTYNVLNLEDYLCHSQRFFSIYLSYNVCYCSLYGKREQPHVGVEQKNKKNDHRDLPSLTLTLSLTLTPAFWHRKSLPKWDIVRLPVKFWASSANYPGRHLILHNQNWFLELFSRKRHTNLQI